MREWLTRGEALAKLRVRPQTLYAYVSRGLVGRASDPADPRRSLYRAEDVEALHRRRTRGRGAAAIATGAIAWGEPVIDTALSTVAQGRLVYRGHDAAALAQAATLEEVAALLWDASPPLPVAGRVEGGPIDDTGARGSAHPRPLPQAGEGFSALAALASESISTIGRPRARLVADAVQAVATLAAAMGARGEGPIHMRLARGWGLASGGEDLVRRALVLLADHELNPSTFATRVSAATGASLAASLLAGLAALSGPRHGGAGRATAALAAEAERDGAEAAVGRWLASGHALPGFGHPLYPYGDPRAVALLAGVTVDADLANVAEAVAAATEALPNIDFALLAATRAAGWPTDAPFRLFAVARSVGWAAHAMEQAASGAAIRPRARYVGMT